MADPCRMPDVEVSYEGHIRWRRVRRFYWEWEALVRCSQAAGELFVQEERGAAFTSWLARRQARQSWYDLTQWNSQSWRREQMRMKGTRDGW